MKRALLIVLLCQTLLGFTASVREADAAIVYESAAVAPRTTFCCGFPSIFSENYSVNHQWLGARFAIVQAMHITAIGGIIHLFEGELFAAIVKLDAIDALPHGLPFDSDELVFSTVLSNLPPVDNISIDYRQSVSVDLEPGFYGLLFGAGEGFSSNGFGGMHQGVNLNIGSPTYFFYGNQGQFPGGPIWRDGGVNHARFVVEGEARTHDVPEPHSLYCVPIALALFVKHRK